MRIKWGRKEGRKHEEVQPFHRIPDADVLHSCCDGAWVHHSCGLWENHLRVEGGDDGRGGGVREAGKEPSFSPVRIFS